MSAPLDFCDVREWTRERLADLLDEPRDHDLDWRRFEIVDGMLVVSPAASRTHEAIVARLIVALSTGVPSGFGVLGSTAIEIGQSYRITDVTVLADQAICSPDRALLGDDVLLAVEVESPSSITTDRVTKPAQYADAGIPFFWRVETAPLRLVAYRLGEGVYVEVGSWGADEVARIGEPFEVEIAVGSLLPSDAETDRFT